MWFGSRRKESIDLGEGWMCKIGYSVFPLKVIAVVLSRDGAVNWLDHQEMMTSNCFTSQGRNMRADDRIRVLTCRSLADFADFNLIQLDSFNINLTFWVFLTSDLTPLILTSLFDFAGYNLTRCGPHSDIADLTQYEPYSDFVDCNLTMKYMNLM